MPKVYKVTIIGDPGVGKTSIALRQAQGSFPAKHYPTLGTNFHIWNTIIGNQQIKLIITDTGSQEVFYKVLPTYFKNSTAAAIIFDITNRQSFERIKFWHKMLIDSVGDIPFIIAGNKIDLENERTIDKEEAEKLAKELNSEYIEVSAKTRENLDTLFRELAKLALREAKKVTS